MQRKGRSVKRRDFLLLRHTPRGAFLELSCEQLYVRYVDARVYEETTDLLTTLREELEDVDVLHLTDTAWLADEGFRRTVDEVLTWFRMKGGRVTGLGI
jgi:hypothetical protein